MATKSKSASLTVDATEPNNQLVVVICAVSDQLHVDGHALDPSKTMDKDYGYSTDLMFGFLGGVHGRLAWHSPPYDFPVTKQFSDDNVSATVGALITKINNATQPREAT
jgi:hypothetical protein